MPEEQSSGSQRDQHVLFPTRPLSSMVGSYDLFLRETLTFNLFNLAPFLTSSMKLHGRRHSMAARINTPASAQSAFSFVKESGWTATVRSVRTVVPKPEAAASRAVASTQ